MIDSYLGNTFSVGELLEALKTIPADMPVITEGCDCYGTIRQLEVIDGTLYLNREKHERPDKPVELNYERS